MKYITYRRVKREKERSEKITKEKFYDATNDSMFKAVFTNPKNKDLLETLIGEALKTKIEVVSILPPEAPKENIAEKGKTLDVLIKSNGKLINIELNSSYYKTLHRRNAAYIFKEYSIDLNSGDDYDEMNNHIQINLTLGLGKKYPPVCIYRLVDKEHKREYIDNLTIYEFNLNKIKKLCYNRNNEEYKMLAALCCNKKELEKICQGNEMLEKFMSEVERMNKDRKFANMMSQEEEAKKLHNTLMHHAKDEGFQEGVEYGIEQGIEQGIKQKTKETALNMLKKDIDKNTISEITGLSIKEIENLK